MKRICDRGFIYNENNNAASHSDPAKFRARMAERMRERDAQLERVRLGQVVVPIKERK